MHLYPGPSTVADQLLTTDEERSADVPISKSKDAVDDQTREAVRASFRRGWYVNLFLLVTGSAASILWLFVRGRHRTASWLAVAGIGLFVVAFILFVVPSRAAGFDQWIALMQRLVVVKAWSFLGAEVHRAMSLLVAVIALFALGIATSKRLRS
jgi:hypothetical protein